jgi:hypothetical protein
MLTIGLATAARGVSAYHRSETTLCGCGATTAGAEIAAGAAAVSTAALEVVEAELNSRTAAPALTHAMNATPMPMSSLERSANPDNDAFAVRPAGGRGTASWGGPFCEVVMPPP